MIDPSRGGSASSRAIAWFLRSLPIVAALFVASANLQAATFVFESGEALDGEILEATPSTVIIRRDIGGVRQARLADLREVRIDTASGQRVTGLLLGWSKGVYEVQSGDRLVRLRDGRILSSRAIPPQADEEEESITEYEVGDAVIQNGLEVGSAYLLGVSITPPAAVGMGEDTIHLECDVSAAEGNPYGFKVGEFVPYLTCSYAIEQLDSDWRTAGTMLPMTAKDGPHYAQHIHMNGPGRYRVVYFIDTPVRNGFFRHSDEVTGVPDWWQPFSVEWTFDYPSEPETD